MIFRILLVDDEPAITDWLQHLIATAFGDGVDVYKTDNAASALRMMAVGRFDIVVLDINMPGDNGIAAMERIAAEHPSAKIIFLTGYRQFEYARRAVHDGVVAYVLKNEDDDALLGAVRKAMDRVRDEIAQRELIEDARRRLDDSSPIVRRELLIRLFQGLIPPESVKHGSDWPVAFNIAFDRPACLLIGSASGRDPMRSAAESLKRLYAAGLIVEESLGRHFRFESAMPDETSWTWLLQPKDGGDWNELSYTLLRSVLEHAQTAYSRAGAGNLVFVYGAEPVGIGELPAYYMRLRPLQGYAADGEHAVFTERDWPDGEAAQAGGEADSPAVGGEPAFRKAAILQKLLERGEREPYYRMLDGMLATAAHAPHRHHPLAVEALMTVSAVLLSYMNRTGMYAKMADRLPLHKLYDPCGATDAAAAFRAVSEALFELQCHKRATRSDEAIRGTQAYIERHLDRDLSLIMLADRVRLNPSYFSILFKNTTGMNVSDFIKRARLDRAKELLAERKLRIHEIGRMVGYHNAAYFTKFFKAEAGMSPQEYRDAALPRAIER